MTVYFSGYVYQDDGDALSGATVQLLQVSDGAEEASTTSDSNGLWAFNEADDDRYDVKITKGSSVRYRKWADEISLKTLDVRNNEGNGVGAASFTNLTNNASNQVATFSGANSTRADGDEIYLSFKLANSAGDIEEFARITAEAVDVTDGAEDGQLRFGVAKTDGTITDVFTINSTTGGETSMTLDVSGDLTLDADGGDVFFKDGGTTFGSATNNSGNLILKSGTTTALTFSGANLTAAGTIGSGAITATGIIKTDDATDATSTTDGSLQTDGGLSVVKDAVFGDDVKLLSDSAVLSFGGDSDTTLTHTDGTGLTLNSTNKLTFGDTGTFIHQSSDGVLTITSDTTVDINGAVAFDGALTGITALTVDDVVVDGKVITMTGSASDTAVFTAGTNGTLSIVTTDAAAAAANIQITADGTVDIDSAGVLTLDSGAAINLEPAGGSAVLIDGTVSIDGGAITGVASILEADVKIGEDDQTKIDFETADEIHFYAGNENQLTLTDGALTPSSNAILDLGTDALEFKDAYFDGTVEADAITIGGTNIVTGSLITTLGTISAGTWNGTAIASAYLDSDTAHLSGTQTFSGAKTFSDDVTISGNDVNLIMDKSYIEIQEDPSPPDHLDDHIRLFGTNIHGLGISTDEHASEKYTSLGADHLQFEVASTISTVAGALVLDGTGGVVVNPDGDSVDFRVEGDTVDHLLLVDGSADKIGIGITPTSVAGVAHIYGAEAGEGTALGQLAIQSSTVYGSTPDAGIVFLNEHTTGSQAVMGGIKVTKSNTGDGDLDSTLSLQVRKHGAVAYNVLTIDEDALATFNGPATGANTLTVTSTDANANLALNSDTDEGQDSEILFQAGGTTKGRIEYDHHGTASTQNMYFYVADNANAIMRLRDTRGYFLKDLEMNYAGTAQDSMIFWDGNASEWHVGLQDSNDSFVIGEGDTLGSNSRYRIFGSGDYYYGHYIQHALTSNGAASDNKAVGVAIGPDLTGHSGDSGFLAQVAMGVDVGGSITTAGVSAVAATLYLSHPDLGDGSGTVTDAATLYIKDAADDGTNQYALLVDSGNSRFDGDIHINSETTTSLTIGASNDFKIYHNGSNSHILDNGTGNLLIGSNGSEIRFHKNAADDFLARFVIDGSIMLYYDNSLKFETTTSGIAVTGGVAASGSDQVFTATAADGTNVHYVGGNAATGSLDDEESFTFTMANGGLFTVTDSTTRYAGVFAFSYASSTIVEISDPDNKFVTTNTDSGNLIAVYTTTNSHVVTVHNRTNSTQTLRVYAHGDVSAASGIS